MDPLYFLHSVLLLNHFYFCKAASAVVICDWSHPVFYFPTTVEPTEEDLKCFNDYETEMKCSLSTDRLKSCSGYKLNITHTVFNMWVFVQNNKTKCIAVDLAISWHEYLLNSRFQDMYVCMFERSHHSDNCECKIKVQGFVVTEIFNTTLLEGTNVILSKTFKTEDFSEYKCCL